MTKDKYNILLEDFLKRNWISNCNGNKIRHYYLDKRKKRLEEQKRSYNQAKALMFAAGLTFTLINLIIFFMKIY